MFVVARPPVLPLSFNQEFDYAFSPAACPSYAPYPFASNNVYDPARRVQDAAHAYAAAQARVRALQEQRARARQEELTRLRAYQEALRVEEQPSRHILQFARARQPVDEFPFMHAYDNVNHLPRAHHHRANPFMYHDDTETAESVIRRRALEIRQREVAEARAKAAARCQAERVEQLRREELARMHWAKLLGLSLGGAAGANEEQSTEPSAPSATSAPQHVPVSQPTTSDIRKQSANPTSRLVEQLKDSRLNEDDEMREVVEGLLRNLFGIQTETEDVQKADRKGKGREHPAIPFSFTKKEEQEPQIQKSVHFAEPDVNSQSSEDNRARLRRTKAVSLTQDEADEVHEHLESRHVDVQTAEAPAQDNQTSESDVKLSLGTISRIQTSLHALQSAFTFPTDFDLPHSASSNDQDSFDSLISEPSLPFTSLNKPLHAYTHSLTGLLTQLDAVESFGSEEVRGRRKAVVGEVEAALEGVERKVRERSRERSERERASQETLPPLPSEAQPPLESVPLKTPLVDNPPAIEVVSIADLVAVADNTGVVCEAEPSGLPSAVPEELTSQSNDSVVTNVDSSSDNGLPSPLEAEEPSQTPDVSQSSPMVEGTPAPVQPDVSLIMEDRVVDPLVVEQANTSLGDTPADANLSISSTAAAVDDHVPTESDDMTETVVVDVQDPRSDIPSDSTVDLDHPTAEPIVAQDVPHPDEHPQSDSETQSADSPIPSPYLLQPGTSPLPDSHYQTHKPEHPAADEAPLTDAEIIEVAEVESVLPSPKGSNLSLDEEDEELEAIVAEALAEHEHDVGDGWSDVGSTSD